MSAQTRTRPIRYNDGESLFVSDLAYREPPVRSQFNAIELVETFGRSGCAQSLGGSKDRHVRDPSLATALLISGNRLSCRHVDEVPDRPGATSLCDSNQRCPIFDRGVDVVDDNGTACGKQCFELTELTSLTATCIWPQVFAEMRVGRVETLPVEARLSCTWQSDQNHALRHGLPVRVWSLQRED